MKRFVIRCRAVIMHEGKMLLVRHPHDTSYAALPGGHLEFGEDILECMEREIVEELGVRPEIGKLFYVNNFTDEPRSAQVIEFFFEIINGADYIGCEKLSRSHSDEISEIIWADPKDDIRILPPKLGEDFRNGKIKFDGTKFIPIFS